MKKINLLIVLTFMCSYIIAQEEIKLYPKGAKESNELAKPESFRDKEFIMDISEARMYAYPAPKNKANGVAVVICPGGGYAGVSQIKEGSEFAQWFNELGISAFVLYYRMPNGHYNVPLTDVQTAFSIIRKRAGEWKINKTKIGIMGFSAGGHLASTAGTHFKNNKERPAFMILGYPVVTMKDDFAHKGSRQNLLGQNQTDDLINLFSNELQVTKQTPPTFIVHAKDDKVVPIENSRNLAKALQGKDVPVQLVEYDLGGHGFGMRKKGIPADNWTEQLKIWLIKQNLIKTQVKK